MISKRALFIKHIAQTSDAPSIIEVASASGIHITDVQGKKFTDLSCGIGPSILGHGHPLVQSAIQRQSNDYLHTMVYGEHVQSPQVHLATLLLDHLSDNFEQVYFLSSGSEAIEAALKVAKIHTDRSKIISASNAYHGSTIGAESLRSDVEFVSAIAPVVPDVYHIGFNIAGDLNLIDHSVAAVVMETIQAENGVIIPDMAYMKALRRRCTEVGALLILDEIQVGIGRTGKLFAFEHFDISPDILVLGKAIGGGLPLSAVISSTEIMQSISTKLPLAHLTTFGGHPLCCAAGGATLSYIIEHKLWERAEVIGQRFENNLEGMRPWKIRRKGAMIAFDVGSEQAALAWHKRLHSQGVITDLLLFDLNTWRISPPLIISDEEIDQACEVILNGLE